MKRVWKAGILFMIAALVVLLPASIVFGAGKGTLKGTVTDTDEAGGKFTLATKYGEVTILAPDEFDFSMLDEEATFLVKGQWLNETEFQAEWVKPIGPGEKENGKAAGQNAFCTEAKDSNHPLAAKIYAKFGESAEVDQDTIMAWFCEGHSFGQIMLAFTTHMLDPDLDPYEVLMARKDGQGWGKIWKENGLIGDERQGMPPGWVHKPEGDIPPGLLNKPDNLPPGQQKKNNNP